MNPGHLFVGQIVHCKSLNDIELIVNGFMVVENGKIIDIGSLDNLNAIHNYSELESTKLLENEFLLPGFVDCHIHASQMPNLGLGLDKELLEWLDEYTFPLEAEYKDLNFAQHVYKKVVSRTLQLGTTCACYFATNDKNATKILADEVEIQGQRALVGKVSVNCLCPDYYVETTNDSLRDNIEFVEYLISKNNERIKPVITPRFALSCDKELMSGLGEIAAKYDLHVQSHISESLSEIQRIRQKYPENENYASVYDSVNLLTSKCILAHGVHLEDEELKLLSERKTAIAHCPTSNINLSSGLCDVKRILEAGVKVGLGTDVSGGNKVSILDVLRATLQISHSLEFIKKQDIKGCGRIANNSEYNLNYKPLDYKQALYLATLGGAESLAWDNKIGNFEIGKDFDALVIDVNQGNIDYYNLPKNLLKNKTKYDLLVDKLEKFLYSGDDRNIVKVYVNGKLVKGQVK